MSDGSARLEVVAGKAMGMSILVDGELIIGRQASGAGRLADDEEISRAHARVSVEATGFCAIEDLGSTNGTFVNGLRITSPQTLSENDAIELGATTLVVRDLPSQQPAGATGRPQPTIVPAPVPRAPQPPTPAPAAEPPAPDAAPPAPAPAPAKLSLEIEVDFDAREARLRINEAADAIRLGFDGASWGVTHTGEPEGDRTL